MLARKSPQTLAGVDKEFSLPAEGAMQATKGYLLNDKGR